jgi:histone deacetylase 6
VKADEVKGYIDRGVGHSFGIMDVNIPEHITADAEEEANSYRRLNGDETRKQAEKLAVYLWENYIEPSEAENLYLMGVGNAFHGFVKLLCERGERLSGPGR